MRRSFTSRNFPGIEELGLFLGGVENLNRNCQVFPAEHTCFMVGTLWALCVYFFHFSRDRLRQKQGLLIVYTMYIRGLPCQCSSKFQVVCLFVCVFYVFLLFIRQQSIRTVPSCTNLAKESVVFIKSTRMVLDLILKCFVTKNLLAGDGQWPRRGWVALWISTATGLTTRMALVTLMASFSSDWTKYTAWQNPRASSGSIWKILSNNTAATLS